LKKRPPKQQAGSTSLHITSERPISADVCGAFLNLLLRGSCGLRRKLKYRCLLAFTEFCQENHLPVGKFQRIMENP
jgi:hypothetical protein